RHHALDPGLEAQRLEDRGQETGEEHRSVAASGAGRGAAQGRLAVGARPCRPPGERAGGPPRAAGDPVSIDLATLLLGDPLRLRALQAVAALALPDCWIGAGFVREAVWDRLHGRPIAPPSGDVDVIWFDPANADPAVERVLETRLAAA